MELDKNYKVRVTPEQSRQIQELVFKLGGSLQSGDTFVKETHLERLYVGKCLKMSFGLTEHGWSYQEGATIQADELIALLADLSKSAENPLENMKLTPEFESAETVLVYNCEVNTQDNSVNTQDNSVNIQDTPKFKVGDPVYCPSLLDGRIYKARENDRYLNDGCKLFVANEHEDCFDFEVDGSNQYNNPIVYHANEETRQALQVLHPDIEFEQPPKPLTGSDLTRAMLDKGWKYVPCFVSDTSEEIAVIKDASYFVARHDGVEFFEPEGTNWRFAVPFDPRTGEPLTESILND